MWKTGIVGYVVLILCLIECCNCKFRLFWLKIKTKFLESWKVNVTLSQLVTQLNKNMDGDELFKRFWGQAVKLKSQVNTHWLRKMKEHHNKSKLCLIFNNFFSLKAYLNNELFKHRQDQSVRLYTFRCPCRLQRGHSKLCWQNLKLFSGWIMPIFMGVTLSKYLGILITPKRTLSAKY